MKLFQAMIFIFFFLGITMETFSQTEDLYKKAEDAYFEKNQTDAALEILNSIIQMDSNNNNAIYLRIWINSEQLRFKDAIKDQLVFCRRFPHRSANWRNLAWSYLMLEKPETAYYFALKAIEISRTNFKNPLILSHIYSALGNNSKAIFWYLNTTDYIVNKDALDFTYKELKTLKEQNLFKINNYDEITDYFSKTFIAYSKNKANPFLDSIYVYLENGATEMYPKVIEFKKQFLKKEKSEKSPRYFVLRDFQWQVGMYEYKAGNAEKALSQHLIESYQLSYDLGDTLEAINQIVEIVTLEMDKKPSTAMTMFKNLLTNPSLKNALRDTTISNIYLQIAHLNLNINNFDSAIYFARISFIISNRLHYDRLIAASANIMANSFARKNQLDSAIFFNKKANQVKNLDLNLQIAEDTEIGNIIYQNSNFKLAVNFALEKIEWYSIYNPRQDINISGLFEIAGIAYFNLNEYKKSNDYLERSISIYKNWITNFGEPNLDNTPANKLYKSYSSLKAISLNHLVNNDQLFKVAEDSKANGLFITFDGKNYCSNPASLLETQRKLSIDEIAISFNISEKTNASYIIALTSEKVLIQKINILHKLDSLFRIYDLTVWADSIEELAKYFMKLKGYHESKLDEIKSSLYIGVALYGFKSLFNPAEASRGIKMINQSSKEFNKSEMRIKMGKVLYEMLFTPFEMVMKEKKTLIISTDGCTSLLPFEAIIDNNNNYLGQLFTIQYVPSFTIANLINNRNTVSSKNILAIGNPQYSKFTPSESGNGFDLQQAGYGRWSDLPATGVEIKTIKSQSPTTVVLSEKTLNESKIKQISKSQDLLKYGILHFAVHGMFSNNDYSKNALVLTEPNESSEDGFLQFFEILRLKIKSDLVCLSACQTAEAEYSHDVAPNLISAFLMAGSRSVIGTSWQIDDEGTALFMKEFYRLILIENLPYGLALQKCRQAFYTGKFGEKFKDPYYWSAFKYTGGW